MEESSPTPKHVRPNVLVVDDDQVSTMMLELILSDEGFAVKTASSLETALALAEQIKFDVLISDFKLPDGDGCELLSRLLEKRRIMGIMVSGFSDEEHLMKFRAAGFIETITKPIVVESVIRKLKEAFPGT